MCVSLNRGREFFVGHYLAVEHFMSSIRKFVTLFVLGFGVAATGCGGDSKSDGTDGGNVNDGGAVTEAGAAADASDPADTSTLQNDGSTQEAGTTTGSSAFAVSTVSGSKNGLPGDNNGALESAQFSMPFGIVVKPDGDMIVFETQRRVRKISGGQVTLLTQLPLQADPRSGVLGLDGNIYVADSGRNCIVSLAPEGAATTFAGVCAGGQGATDGPLAMARFRDPEDIVLDRASGTFYVADTGNDLIRKITADGQVSTIAGVARMVGTTDGVGAVARFRTPTGVALDGQGHLYVADFDNHRIRKINLTTLEVTTLAGQGEGYQDGQGTAALFNFPRRLVYDGGNLFVTDTKNHRIRMVTAGGLVSTVAGGVGPGTAPGAGPGAGFRDSENGLDAFFSMPFGIDRDATGNLYVTETTGGHRVRKLTRK